MSVRLLAPTTPGAAVRRALPLTRTLTNVSKRSLLTNIVGRTSAYTITQYNVLSTLSRITTTHLLSSSRSTFDKKHASTNAGRDASPSRLGTDSRQTLTSPEDEIKISFRDLGMNRTTKFVVYTVIGILGTMETIFWCKAIWRWWTGGEENKE